jgi:hypothetical protein
VAERIGSGAITLGRILAVLAVVVLHCRLAAVMSFPASWIAVGAGLAQLLGLSLILVGRGLRERRGPNGHDRCADPHTSWIMSGRHRHRRWAEWLLLRSSPA